MYLSPEGDDARSGLALEQSVRSLACAQEVISRATVQAPNDAEVRISPGTYVGQTVKWSFFMAAHSITFLPLSDDKNRPVFDGEGRGTWFTFSARADGAPTNLIFRYLKVQNYQTAISFNGNRNDAQSSSRGNTIYGCYFLNVGEKSTAAVRLVNSSGNRIVNSHFVSIVSSAQPGILHAIYAAHGSSENLILRNRFKSCCGDTIRFRDASNGNTVEGNRFILSGENAAVSDWYCDHDKESDCTKPTPECPSWKNIVRQNLLDRNFAGGRLKATFVYSEHLPSGCAAPAPEMPRFVVSENGPAAGK